MALSRRETLSKRPGGALGYFLGGYVPPGTPNWHPVLKKNSPKIDTPFWKWANFLYSVLESLLIEKALFFKEDISLFVRLIHQVMASYNHREYVSCACGYNAVNYDAKSVTTHRTTLVS